MRRIVGLGKRWRIGLSGLLAGSLILALLAATAGAATTLTVSTVADTSASAGACGNSSITTAPSPLSLREATCLANNIGGEVNISVPAGTYKLDNGELSPGLKVGQTVNITGAGAASTIIDAQGKNRVLQIDTNSVGSIKSTITGVTITGGEDTKFGGAGILDGSLNLSSADELTLESVVVKNNDANLAVSAPGGGVAMDGGQLNVYNSTFEENRSHGSAGSAIVTISNPSTGGNQSTRIVGSIFKANRTANGSANYPYPGAIDNENFSGSIEITESSFINNESTSTAAGGAVGAAIFSRATTPITVTRSTFIGNTVASSGGGTVAYSAISSERAEETLTLHYDRFQGNNTSSAVGGAATFNATENWWGCNGGPGTAGCDGVGGSGSITTSPRLQLTGSASPSTVAGPNGTSTLSAGFLTDSSGNAVAPANLAAFNGATVTWSDPQPSPATVNGKAAPQTSTTAISSGKATATYNSSSAAVGAGHAVASFDNASQTIGLTVDRKPEVTTNPTDQMATPGSTATFTAAASGTPTPTVQWQRDKGQGGGFENISAATATTYSFTAQSQETGWRFRAVFTSTIEGTPYTATTTAATLTVGKATPTLTSAATSATIGGAIHDSATISGGSAPGGAVEFRAYGPGDTTCSAGVRFAAAKSVTGNGTYESGDYTPGKAGEYRWVVVYSGDSLNEEVISACGATGETSIVSQATTLLATSATGTTIGGEVHDSATLSGGHSPGGSITFKAFSPTDTTCTGTPVTSSTVTVSANGSYESEAFKPTEGGSYRWVATYSGDTNNKGAAGTCGEVGETSAVAKVTPTISTAATSGAVGTGVKDTATLSGGFSPGGQVTFMAYAPGDTTCSATPAFTGTVSVSGNGAYESKAFTPTAAGSYRWVATYSGDASNVGSAGTCGETGETSSIAKVTPTISTAATSGAVGTGVKDTATISGGYSPGGSIVFKAYGAGDPGCGEAAVFTSTVTVSANGSYESEAFKPTESGSYRWVATYSGDGNNQGAAGSCGEAGETSSLGTVTPALSTKATDATVGGQIHDVAELSGGFQPGGTIVFSLFPPSDPSCEGTPVASTSVSVSGDGSYESAAYTTNEAGSYRWVADYSGDGNNQAVESNCGETLETSAVAKASPTLATVATSGNAGGQIHDTATLTGGVSPGGSIAFEAFAPGDTSCTGTPVETSTVTVTGTGNYDSPSFVAAAAGSYRWVATYSGDGNNVGAAGTCGEAGEISTVGKASPTLTTSATDATVGAAIHDSATLTGGTSAGGQVTFVAYGPGDTTCATPVETLTVSVSGDGTYESGPFTPTAAGSYRWVATYSGDANNEGAEGACGDSGETSTLAKATPTLSTSATDAVLGNPVHDTATLGGGYSAGGQVTFKLFDATDTTCAGTPVLVESVTVTGNGSYGSGNYTPAQVGEYRWVATYTGDGNNEGTAGACGEAGETSHVAKAAPTLSTSATDTVVGGRIHDTAELTGGQSAGGTLDFEAFGPGDAGCTGTPVANSTVPVSGDGSYESASYTAEEAGAYHWVVTYSGDPGNLGTESSCGDAGETSTVAKAAPTISTTATASVTLGGSADDTAILAGGHSPGGTLTFKAFAPADTTCAGAPAFTSTVPVSGSGSYRSAAFTPAAAGAYRWVASYSGDANDEAVAGACGDAGETTTVAAPPVVPTNPAGLTTPDQPKPCAPLPPTSAGGYTPKKKVKGQLVPGVRARIQVAEPSEIEVAATLHYRSGGSPRSVDLGTVSLENPGARNVRLPLPASLRETLPLGTNVRLALQVSSTPAAGCSAATPHRTRLLVRTKVLRILVAE